LDTELAITQQTAPPLQQAASLGIADIDTTVNSQGTKKRRSQMQADYVCLQMLRTIMSQNSSIAAMLKEDGAKKTKKDLFKEIVHAWRKSSDEKINTLKDINMNYYCKKILDGVQEILSEEHRERFAMLAENGNAQTLEEPLCEYDSMLLQLCVLKKIKSWPRSKRERLPGRRWIRVRASTPKRRRAKPVVGVSAQ